MGSSWQITLVNIKRLTVKLYPRLIHQFGRKDSITSDKHMTKILYIKLQTLIWMKLVKSTFTQEQVQSFQLRKKRYLDSEINIISCIFNDATKPNAVLDFTQKSGVNCIEPPPLGSSPPCSRANQSGTLLFRDTQSRLGSTHEKN